MSILKATNLTRTFGGIKAVTGVNLEINDGELIGLIGPNGAGKTTIFNLLTGVYEPSDGSICFLDKNTRGMEPFKVTKLGMARTFQNIRLFSDVSVLDNVKIAYHNHANYGILSSILRLPSYSKGEKIVTNEAMELLKIFKLESKAYEIARNLPYGEQRRLEIARALATQPRLLLLDEPAAGMNPNETQELMEMIRWVRENFKITILLIEHDMSLVMGVCERIYVLDYGQIIASGTPDEIKNNPRVIEAYLGEEVAHA